MSINRPNRLPTRPPRKDATLTLDRQRFASELFLGLLDNKGSLPFGTDCAPGEVSRQRPRVRVAKMARPSLVLTSKR